MTTAASTGTAPRPSPDPGAEAVQRHVRLLSGLWSRAESARDPLPTNRIPGSGYS